MVKEKNNNPETKLEYTKCTIKLNKSTINIYL